MRVFISFVSVVDLDSTFLTPEMAARFANVSQEQGDEIIAEKDSKKTQKQTKYAMNAFNCWLAARQHVIDEKTIPVGEFARRFKSNINGSNIRFCDKQCI